ncbi:hypothetical protein [Sneathiella aquimaris]|uniref:hypothetical protein n=1 Tax=Sneathiella aquimaris TaxID=2599305 RepID=UPI00146A5479|nr:hypothetical protein [Sneathiella aquimaris]
MLNKNLTDYSVFGFAKFEMNETATTEKILAASLQWQRSFLAPIEGVGFHSLLSNMKGGFADIIFFENQSAFDQMHEQYSEADSSRALLSLINPESIVLRSGKILQNGFQPPEKFGCIEVGFMTVENKKLIGQRQVLSQSERMESAYLSQTSNTLSHVIGQTSEVDFCEITFGHSLAETREVCFGYLKNDQCLGFLQLFDEKHSEFDFWVPVA